MKKLLIGAAIFVALNFVAEAKGKDSFIPEPGTNDWSIGVHRPVHSIVSEPVTHSESTKSQTAKVTAYSCGGLGNDTWKIAMNCPSLLKGGPRTASGTKPRPYVTAACPRHMMGDRIELENIGPIVCEDVGGAIKGNRIDLYVPTYDDAIKWGVKYLEYSKI